ncbi:PHD-finger family protein [Wuchereria bancrofti]|uniref:PHD-finger family protein n=1 Tax=Wuchereria bancrofti TaxID=6293 RepID=J9FKJ2_WUCBA|nr:PHD-finger family protein [Wuchereria bancrofti]
MDESEEIDFNNKPKILVENKQKDCFGTGEELEKDSREIAGNNGECEKHESPKQELDAHILQHAIQKLYSDPSFAVICSFFNKFAVFLGLKPQCFAKMENMFTSFHVTGKVDRDLIDLHLMLMRKLTFKSARLEVWEKYLLKFCSLVPSLETEYLQLERYGYLHTTAATKLAILKALCESQFDFNVKFKESLLNSCAASDLRLLPIGYDKEGLAYLYQQDADLVIRIYSAEQDDHSGGSWNLVANYEICRTLDELLQDSSSTPAVAETDEQTNVLSIFLTKRGALLDTYQDESAVKKKLVRPSQIRKKVAVEEESKKENSAPPVEITEDIPDEVKPFLDRRVLPRRSARSAAINQLKELTAPLKPQSGRRKNQQNKKQVEVENTKQLKILDKNDDQDDSEDNDENEKDDNDGDDFILAETSTSSDDEFMPLSELKKRNQNSRRRRGRKAVVEKDPFEIVESEEDEDSDDDQEKKAKKERKKATEETLCMKCSKSSNPEVLLLCDLCDEAWHTWCLHPILWYVPDDDWFCPNCQQAMLIEKFSKVLTVLAEQVKRKAAEDKKKEAAAERLKREMEYIGASLNNIIDTVRDAKMESSESSEESGEDDGERKSKKKAIRRLGVYPQKPIIPIALSRSRRQVAKVDYKFGAYDELIQEAVKNIDESAARQMSPGMSSFSFCNIRPKGGAGRGKDMSNIINAENKRIPTNVKDSYHNDGLEGHVRMQSKIGKPAKSRHRLNDLNVDEMTESDTDEYQGSDSASVSDPSDDTDEYLPSDASHTRRTSKRNYSNKRTQSDDDFVVSGSESEYEPLRKKSYKPKNTKKIKGKRKLEKWTSSDEDSTSELSDNYRSEESSSSVGRRAKRRATTKWAPRASSSDAEDSNHSVQKTAAGRPLRKAVAKRPSLTVDNDDDEEGEDEEMEKRVKDVRPVGLGRKIESSDEFEPDEEEEEEADEEETVDDEETEDKEETSTVDDEKQSQSDEEESVEGKERKTVKVENDIDVMGDVTFSSTKTLSADDDEKQAEDVDDACPSTSNDLIDEVARRVKSEQMDQEIFYNESTKTEDVKKVEVKVAEKAVVTNVATTSSNVTSYVPPSCFPSTSADLSSLNPSSVMQQMARLASSSAAPMQQFDPSSIAYRDMLQTTAPTFIANGTPLHIYSGPAPVTVYQVQQPPFVRTPTGIVPSNIGPLPQSWHPYPPPNFFPANAAAPPMVIVTTTSSPTTDSETLGNVLASAMDY